MAYRQHRRFHSLREEPCWYFGLNRSDNYRYAHVDWEENRSIRIVLTFEMSSTGQVDVKSRQAHRVGKITASRIAGKAADQPGKREAIV